MIRTGSVVVVTGAEGRIGSGFREEYLAHYRQAYRLRLAVRDAAFRDERFEDTAVFDLEDPDRTGEAVSGADAVLHLAANANERASWEELLGPNVVGVRNLFEAARRAGCRRVVFASSVHAIMGYPTDSPVRAEDAPRPDCLYGATKAFGEALGATSASLFGVSCIAIRIGAYAERGKLRDMVARFPDSADMAVSQRDLSQLVHRCILAPPEVVFAVVNGASNNRRQRMEIDSARRLLGYDPQDDGFAAGPGA